MLLKLMLSNVAILVNLSRWCRRVGINGDNDLCRSWWFNFFDWDKWICLDGVDGLVSMVTTTCVVGMVMMMEPNKLLNLMIEASKSIDVEREKISSEAWVVNVNSNKWIKLMTVIEAWKLIDRCGRVKDKFWDWKQNTEHRNELHCSFNRFNN